MADTGIVILAAGSSLRMGVPKQLLQYKGKSFLQHMTGQALNAPGAAVVAVVANDKSIIDELHGNPGLTIAINEAAEEGMASSIRIGLGALLQKEPGIQSCIFIVCDQPFVTTELLQKIITEAQNGVHGIVACSYDDTFGVPALFKKVYFRELLQLKGQEGAKKLLKMFSGDMSVVSFPPGKTDIDTPEDYNNLLQGIYNKNISPGPGTIQ
ncbi:nucleotidyltransferase family protein [Chitinophagaceae bacterium MMS25-I14]